MDGPLTRRILAAGTAGALALGAAACGGSSSGQDDGKVTITVNGMPPKTETVDRKNFEDDVREFEKSHPDIDIEPREGLMDPKTFSAKLAGGQLEDVYYVYFTDAAGLIERRQAADITEHLEGVPGVDDVRPELQKIFEDGSGHAYGLPTGNYSLGLLYNRELFDKAGLDPDRPPTTWAEVREAADAIGDLGDGVVGYADYSKNNQGGWHLTSWIYSMGGDVAVPDGEEWKSALDDEPARQALQMLHDMRWTDDSMGTRQLLEIADVQRMMGAGKLGMYMAGPDNIPTIVKQYERGYDGYGLAALPGGATLGGGDGFMFNPKATPEQIDAGIEWITWKFYDAGHEETHAKRSADADVPIGLPQPNLFTGTTQQKMDAVHAKYANVPQENYGPFVEREPEQQLKVEPPNAQQIYTVLDGVMQAVLTKQDADIDQLLADAAEKVDGILATAE